MILTVVQIHDLQKESSICACLNNHSFVPKYTLNWILPSQSLICSMIYSGGFLWFGCLKFVSQPQVEMQSSLIWNDCMPFFLSNSFFFG
uniref:Uncharacterized protein n=1 Tax=Arundo donax TaxID=35708 RepID=A0A0A8XSV6_ARUDO